MKTTYRGSIAIPYGRRQDAARAAGLLWGATAGDATIQFASVFPGR
jgi:hypothetical protein